MDSLRRTSLHTLSAQTALVEVDVRDISFYRDGTELTFFLTLATTDTSSLTSLHGYRTFVFVDTRHEDSPTLHTLLTKFDDVTGTCLHTSTTRGTFLLVNLGKSCLRIHVDGIKLTGGNTVATSQTTKTTCCLTGTTRIHCRTGAQATVLGNLWTEAASAVTTDDSYHRLTIGDCHSQQISHFTHHFLSTDGAFQTVKTSCVSTFHQCVSKTATACKAASTAVGTWQQLCHLCDTGIFVDSEFLGADIQYNSGYQTDAT